jgi:hypothetical protein
MGVTLAKKGGYVNGRQLGITGEVGLFQS